MEGREFIAQGSSRSSKPSPPLEETLSPTHSNAGKQTYKSWKKKYRKERLKFEEVMRQSNEYFLDEQKALATAQKLALENDRILDILLDVNDCAQIPPDRRIDLITTSPLLSTIPPLVCPEELSEISSPSNVTNQAICAEITSVLEEQTRSRAASRPSKSLAHLLSSTSSFPPESPLIAPDLLASLESIEGHSAPLSYLTLDQQDEHLHEVDISLGLAPLAPSREHPSNGEVDRHPHSVINWLRVHEPRVFLQDGESSDKSTQKPSTQRGAGKRASLPASTKTDVLEIVEEDGISYDFSMGNKETNKGKRKRDEGDDGNYHPKIGRIDDPKPKKRGRKSKIKSEGGSGETMSATGDGEEVVMDKEKPKVKRMRQRAKPKTKDKEQLSSEPLALAEAAIQTSRGGESS